MSKKFNELLHTHSTTYWRLQMKRSILTAGMILGLSTALLSPSTSHADDTDTEVLSRTTITSPNCPNEAGGIKDGWYYTFNETTTANGLHESLNNLPADTLWVTENATDPTVDTHHVTVSGGSVYAYDHGLQTTNSANFSPGTRPFYVCLGIKVLAGEHDGMNMLQWNNSNGHDSCVSGDTEGQIKISSWYEKVQGASKCVKLWDGISGYQAGIWHELGFRFGGFTNYFYLDHKLVGTISGALGGVNLTGSGSRMSLLGKYIESGNYPTTGATYTSDMCNCQVAWVEAGIAP
jgi:hypothetical protein